MRAPVDGVSVLDELDDHAVEPLGQAVPEPLGRQRVDADVDEQQLVERPLRQRHGRRIACASSRSPKPRACASAKRSRTSPGSAKRVSAS